MPQDPGEDREGEGAPPPPNSPASGEAAAFDPSALEGLLGDSSSDNMFGDLFSAGRPDDAEGRAARRAAPGDDPYGFAAAGSDAPAFLPAGRIAPSGPAVSARLSDDALDTAGIDDFVAVSGQDHIFGGPAPAPAAPAAAARAARGAGLRERVAGSMAVLRVRSFWEGPLGWQARREDRGYVRRKMRARYGSVCALVLAAAALAAAPSVGSAYIRGEPDLSKSQSLWGRGVVEYPAAQRPYALSNGSQYTVEGVRGLRAVYAGYWAAFAAAAADGEAGHLSAYATASSVYTTPSQTGSAQAAISSLHAQSYRAVLSGPLADPNALSFESAVPSGDPTEVVAGASGTTSYAEYDSSGAVAGGSALYTEVVVKFDLDGGSWKVASIVFS